MLLFLCAASGTQLWMSEVSSHHSISAACEYSSNLNIDDQIFMIIFYYLF